MSSAGIHPREIPGIDVLANAYPANWLLYTSLQKARAFGCRAEPRLDASRGGIDRKSGSRAALLQQTTFQLKKVYTFETDFDRVTRNAKMFGPMEALWDGYRVVEEDVVVHPRRVWREHRAERVRDLRYKALLRVWAFDQLPAGLNSPDKRRFIADREMRAIGRLTDAGSRLAQHGGILLPIGDDKEEILTQHFELRTLPPNWTTLDRYVAKAQDEWVTEDRVIATTTMLNLAVC